MKTLKEYLNLVDWETIRDRIPKLYPDMDDVNVLLKYQNVFIELLRLIPEENSDEFAIHINEITGVSGDVFWAVNGQKKNGENKYNISFDSWEKWLGYSIHNDYLVQEDIVVHCLYEMTWSGFTQDEIRNKYNEL